MTEYFKLYSDCQIVSGYKNSILLDFTRPEMSNFVPREMSQFIDQCENTVLNDVLNSYSASERMIIAEYLDFLIENDFGFFVSGNLKNNFPPISSKLKNSPEIIDNLIIELDSRSVEHLRSIYLLVEQCLVSSIELRGFKLSVRDLNQIIKVFSSSVVQSLSIYLDVIPEDADFEMLKEITSKNLRVKKIVAFESDRTISSDDGATQLVTRIFNADESIRANIINLSYHIEAQNVCTYRYKKLFIDKDGNLKNHPKSTILIGNFKLDETKTLVEKLKKECDSNKSWFVTRAQIAVCNDCEFRTVCFTNNLPDKGSNYYLKSECTYNPYIGKAVGEEGYRTLKECGVVSNEKEFSIDHEKIAAINEELWGEE